VSDYQQPDVATLARDLYPPLRIREEADPQHPDSFNERERILFDKPVFLTSYQESFNARWQKGDRSYGRLNPMYHYGGTEREANISFTLAAGTVMESMQNLKQCSNLAKSVYGRYKKYDLNASPADIAADPLLPLRPDFTMAGTRYFRVDLGSLIRDERAFISAFSFNINPDAGVHDSAQGGNLRDGLSTEQREDMDRLLATRAKILPRQIDIQISIIFRHDYPLGFGGPRRLGHPNKWADNHTDPSRDWPHGTGPIGVEPYIEGTTGAEVIPRAAIGDVAAPVDPAAADEMAIQYGLVLDAEGNLISAEEPSNELPPLVGSRTPIGGVNNVGSVPENPEDPPTPPRRAPFDNDWMPE
jgi:hypothetical protein